MPSLSWGKRNNPVGKSVKATGEEMAPTHNQGAGALAPCPGLAAPGLLAWLPFYHHFLGPKSSICASALRDGKETFKDLVLDE